MSEKDQGIIPSNRVYFGPALGEQHAHPAPAATSAGTVAQEGLIADAIHDAIECLEDDAERHDGHGMNSLAAGCRARADDLRKAYATLRAQLEELTERYEANTAIMHARTEAMNAAHEKLAASEARLSSILTNDLIEMASDEIEAAAGGAQEGAAYNPAPWALAILNAAALSQPSQLAAQEPTT